MELTLEVQPAGRAELGTGRNVFITARALSDHPHLMAAMSTKTTVNRHFTMTFGAIHNPCFNNLFQCLFRAEGLEQHTGDHHPHPCTHPKPHPGSSLTSTQ